MSGVWIAGIKLVPAVPEEKESRMWSDDELEGGGVCGRPPVEETVRPRFGALGGRVEERTPGRRRGEESVAEAQGQRGVGVAQDAAKWVGHKSTQSAKFSQTV